jgi:copper chaperone CopZ
MLTHVRINGMTCQHRVRAASPRSRGSRELTADVRIGSADVEHDGTVTIEQIREAVDSRIFGLRGRTNRRALPLL